MSLQHSHAFLGPLSLKQSLQGVAKGDIRTLMFSPSFTACSCCLMGCVCVSQITALKDSCCTFKLTDELVEEQKLPLKIRRLPDWANKEMSQA